MLNIMLDNLQPNRNTGFTKPALVPTCPINMHCGE